MVVPAVWLLVLSVVQSPPATLPAGFSEPADQATTKWMTEAVDVPGLRINVAYPDAWRKASLPSGLITFASANDMRSAAIYPPRPMPGPLPLPMPVRSLEQFGETMRKFVPKMKILGFGQSPAGNQHWVWLDGHTADFGELPVPPNIATAIKDSFDGARILTMFTQAGRHLVQIMCLAFQARAGDEAARAAARSQELAECAGMVKRVTFEPR